MTKYALLSLSLLLASCSSNTQMVNYYLLNTPHNETPSAKRNFPLVRIKSVQLSEYLQQPHLAIQIGKNQLYFSPLDVWADPLQQSISTRLIWELNQQDKTHQYVSATPHGHHRIAKVLDLRIDHFHATDNSQVLIEGVFWLQGLQGQPPESTNAIPFSLTDTLEQDGYAHSVSKLRGLITDLARLISEQVAND